MFPSMLTNYLWLIIPESVLWYIWDLKKMKPGENKAEYKYTH